MNLESKKLSYKLIVNIEQCSWPPIYNNIKISRLGNELDVASIDNAPKRSNVHGLKVTFVKIMINHIQ